MATFKEYMADQAKDAQVKIGYPFSVIDLSVFA